MPVGGKRPRKLQHESNKTDFYLKTQHIELYFLIYAIFVTIHE